jgi:hypothetical protein
MGTELKPEMQVMRLAGCMGCFLGAVTLLEPLEVTEGGERWMVEMEGGAPAAPIFILPGSLVSDDGYRWYPWFQDRKRVNEWLGDSEF